MTKSELIEIISAKQKHLPAKDIELAVKQMLEIMSDALAGGERTMLQIVMATHAGNTSEEFERIVKDWPSRPLSC